MIEQGHYPVRNGYTLEWVRTRGCTPRALVFVPPLVGGTVGQQVKAFRKLVKNGLDLFTFNYSGHGRSMGRFSLGTSLRDARDMLLKAQRLGREEDLPLLGIASCYSAIPFLHASDQLSEPMQRLVLINAISRLSPLSVMRSFFHYYNRIVFSGQGLPSIGTALVQYADILFPGVVKNRDSFGVLRRRRARLGKILSEFFTWDPLQDVCLKRTPTLCLYATNDSVLEIYTPYSWSSYRRDIRRICPETEFRVLDGDHFLSRPAVRGKATRIISSFFEAGL